MADETQFLSDNFFSAGRTDIFNSNQEKVGELYLKNPFHQTFMSWIRMEALL